MRTACFLANLVIGEPALVVTHDQEREIALARVDDPYFHAFRARCMQWVYGADAGGPAAAPPGPDA